MSGGEKVKCRKCRRLLLSTEEFSLLDAHGQEYHDTGGGSSGRPPGGCPSVEEHSCLYLSEEAFPNFIREAVDESCWTKGKIHCPGCQARLGSFNFVSGSQCACGSRVLPQVHILQSKVDLLNVADTVHQPVSYPDRPVGPTVALPLDVDPSVCSYKDYNNVDSTAEL